MVCKENAGDNSNFMSKDIVIFPKYKFNNSKRMPTEIKVAAIILNNLSFHKKPVYTSDTEAAVIRCINLVVKSADVSSIRLFCTNFFNCLSSFIYVRLNFLLHSLIIYVIVHTNAFLPVKAPLLHSIPKCRLSPEFLLQI